MDAHKNGTLQEIFGSGTAAVISPVGELKYGDDVITVGGGKVGPLAGGFSISHPGHSVRPGRGSHEMDRARGLAVELNSATESMHGTLPSVCESCRHL